MASDSFENFLSLHARALKRFTERARKAGSLIGEPEMTAAVYRSISAWYGEGLTPADVNKYIDRLRAPDLATVAEWRIALAANNQKACNDFESKAKPAIEAAALTLTSELGKMHDLVDLAITNLRGIEHPTGGRRSILEDFQGRSSLKNWLRAITARLYFDSGESDSATAGSEEVALTAQSNEDDRSRSLSFLQTAFGSALASIEPRDRLRVGLRYIHGLSTARIAKVMREPAGRQPQEIARVRSQIKDVIEARLKEEFQLSEVQIGDCYRDASSEWNGFTTTLPIGRGES